jgi:hypothetical protein
MLPQRVCRLAIVATFAAMPWLSANAGAGTSETSDADKTERSEAETEAVSITVRPQAGHLQVVTGTVRQGGVPVVLVRSDLPGEPWWVQGKPQQSGRNGFSAKAIFGSARTAAGAKFRVVTILAGPADGPFRTGQQLNELPDLPASNQLVVTLTKTGRPIIAATRVEPPLVDDAKKGEDEKEEPRLAELLSPKNGDNVERVTVVKGRIDKGYIPIVLARPLVRDSVWWVQKLVEPDKKGEFELKVVFGSDKTPPGMRFRLVVLAVATKEKVAEFKPGAAVAELPKTIPASREVVVTLRGSEKPVPTATEAAGK